MTARRINPRSVNSVMGRMCAMAFAVTQSLMPAAADDAARHSEHTIVDGQIARQPDRFSFDATPTSRIKEEARLDLPSEDTARAVVRASETASISSELNARITYLPAREGDRFKTGDLLISFDCRRIAAERDAADAAMKAYEAAYHSQLKLLEYKSTGTAAVEQALHQFEKSKAELRSFDVQVQSCQIFAPFDGRMIEKVAQVHEIAQPNQPLIRILNETRLELVMMVPSVWLPRLAGQPLFNIHIDETGEDLPARIVQSTGSIDPVSQSVRVIAEFIDMAPRVLAGMSGTATFSQQRAEK